MWPTLHGIEPTYPFAHSHWKASADPEVRDELFEQDWRNVDYIVISNKMRIAMERNNADGRENWIFEALDDHSEQVWQIERGDVALSIHRVGADVGPTEPADQEPDQEGGGE